MTIPTSRRSWIKLTLFTPSSVKLPYWLNRRLLHTRDLSKKWSSMSFKSPNTSQRKLMLCFFAWRTNTGTGTGSRSNMHSNETHVADSTTCSCHELCKSSRNVSIYLSNHLRKRSMIWSMDLQGNPAIGVEITKRKESHSWRRMPQAMLKKRWLWAIVQK